MRLPTLSIKNVFIFLSVISIVLLSILNIVMSSKPIHEVSAATDTVEQEIKFWEGITIKHPTYRDAYLELTELYLQKENVEAAKNALRKAVEIDPLSERTKSLVESLL